MLIVDPVENDYELRDVLKESKNGRIYKAVSKESGECV